MDAATIYTAADGIATKTTDDGAHWADSSVGISGRWINRLVIDPVSPSTVYVAQTPPFGSSVIYKSADAGAHWTVMLTIGPGPGPGLRALTLAPTQPSTLYIGVNSRGVLKSTDGGASWAAANNGLTAVGPYVSALAVDPTTADTLYAATDPTGRPDTPAKIFKSADGAAHWKEVPIGFPLTVEVTSLVIDRAMPSTVYAVYSDGGDQGGGGVLKSSDSGETWGAALQNLRMASVQTLVIGPGSPSQLYAATSAGVFTSTDGAASWTAINAGLPNVAVSDLSIDRTGSVLRAATIAGLFEYRFDGSSLSATVPVIEYYHRAFDHYFITGSPDEIAKLDAGGFAGWSRTGYHFNAFAAGAPGTSPVCRFFSTAFPPKSSHFYSSLASECSKTRANADWILESADVFDVVAPNEDGSCVEGLAPVFRLFNNGQGGAPNHRYTTDVAVRMQMVAEGWVPEGYGADGVNMCSP